MLEDSAQLAYEPIWITDSNNYLQSFADWNSGGIGNKVHLRSAFVPFEFAEEGSATQQYVDIVTEQRRRHQPAGPAGDLGVPAVGHRPPRSAPS